MMTDKTLPHAAKPLRAASAEAAVLKEHEFKQFQALIYRIAGISLSPAKKALVTTRLGKRLKQLNLQNYSQYYELVTAANGRAELQVMVDLLTTNETHFFREPKHFEFIRQNVIPNRALGRPFRVWSAASSSGEEVYSLAMLLDDMLGEAPWQILGSDLSTRVLEKARTGLYPLERLPEIPKPYLNRYCLKGVGVQDGTLLIERKLRDRVSFFQHNLTEPPPANTLGEFDMIFLRNVMIYFDQETKRQVVGRLLPFLRSGGYFFISHSESLNGVCEALNAIVPAVYQKP